MSAATPTGAELRARRERLGWSTCDAMQAASAHARMLNPGNFGVSHSEILGAESSDAPARHWPSTYRAYAAALTAEEQRRSAAPLTEPVAPEGVRLFPEGSWTRIYSCTEMRGCNIAYVRVEDGDIRISLIGDSGTPVEHVEYVAALSRYRAAQHAAGEQQRKLDAVRAAEEARKEADATYSAALDARDTARKALANAKREAGL